MLNKSQKSSLVESDLNFNFLIEEAITTSNSDPYATHEESGQLTSARLDQPEDVREEGKVE